MKQAKISDLKNNLSRYLDLVREGETVQILDRDTPIAVITSVSSSKDILLEDRLKQMERKGLARIGKPALVKTLIKTPPPGKKIGAVESLLKEREKDR